MRLNPHMDIKGEFYYKHCSESCDLIALGPVAGVVLPARSGLVAFRFAILHFLPMPVVGIWDRCPSVSGERACLLPVAGNLELGSWAGPA